MSKATQPWTLRNLANVAGVSDSTVRKIVDSVDPQPGKWRRFDSVKLLKLAILCELHNTFGIQLKNLKVYLKILGTTEDGVTSAAIRRCFTFTVSRRRSALAIRQANVPVAISIAAQPRMEWMLNEKMIVVPVSGFCRAILNLEKANEE